MSGKRPEIRASAWRPALAILLTLAAVSASGVPAALYGAAHAPLSAGPSSPARTVSPPRSRSAVSELTQTDGTGAPLWVNVTATTPLPPARDSAGFAYDAADGYELLFGGRDGTYSALGDTWVFRDGVWNQLHPSPSPPARFGGAMTFDATDGYVLLFGGYTSFGALNDTWAFLGGKWTQLSPPTAPSPRAWSAMAYDSTDGYVVLFGGATGTVSLGDTWKFVGGTWTNLTGSSAPSARDSAGMANDPSDHDVVMFGGEATDSAELADTWTFAAGAWTQVAPVSGAPAPRTAYQSLAYFGDPSPGLLLFGGANFSTGTWLSDTWTYRSGAWTEVRPSVVPPGRANPGLAWDTTTGVDLLTGGIGTTYFDDTYRWNGMDWALLPPSTVPQPRYDPTLTYDAADHYDVLFGGLSNETSLSQTDTWAYSGGTWTVSNPSVSPGQHRGASMAYDGADQVVVLFGGYSSFNGQTYGDTWEFHAGNWTELNLAVAPPARLGATMAYDSRDGYVVLFGGEANGRLLNDTWVFKGGGWSQVTSPVSPPGRMFAAMSDDATDGHSILFGGCSAINATGACVEVSGDTWAFSSGVWSQLQLPTAPSARAYSAMSYDSAGGYAILYGGSNGSEASDTWEFSHGAWYRLAPQPNPGPLQAFGLTFDNASNSFLLVGGYINGGTTSGSS